MVSCGLFLRYFIQSILGIWCRLEDEIESGAGILIAVATVQNRLFKTAFSDFTDLAVAKETLSPGKTTVAVDVFRFDLDLEKLRPRLCNFRPLFIIIILFGRISLPDTALLVGIIGLDTGSLITQRVLREYQCDPPP